VDAKRRTKKLGKLKGTVRQLYLSGQFEEGETLLATAIPQLTSGNTEPHLDDSDSDASNESWRSGKVRQENPTVYLEPAVELDPAPNWNMENIIATLDEAYHTNDLHPKLQPIYIRPQQDIADPPSSSAPQQYCPYLSM